MTDSDAKADPRQQELREDRLNRVKELLEHAEGLPEEERQAFLREACGDDGEIFGEVISLLELENESPLWPERPLLGSSGQTSAWGPPPGASLEPGQMFGPYRVVRLLGSGGMGVVAEAVREGDFEKKVALKVVHERLPKAWIERFEQERQVLARLEHPNIARILDGGAADEGRPWFAMELVVGDPIDVYCRDKGLSVRQILELMRRVCSALDLAHRNLIVHRDLKPSNLLVNEQGEPKLLDFGIAKRLDDGDELTRLRERPMTLRYGAPEQVRGGLITTATDVYGLGLLLFELLTGRRPFEAAEAEGSRDYELSIAILDQTAPAPSQIVPKAESQALRGDLDAIVGKALRKEPEDRYGSVAELAADLDRHLRGHPVRARQGSWAYSTRLFVRRHRAPVIAALMIIVLGLVFGIGATVLWRRAEQARFEAVEARAAAIEDRRLKDESLDFLKDTLRIAGPNENQGGYLDARGVVAKAEENLESKDALVQAELLATIATVYRSWGDLEKAGNASLRAEALLWELYPEGHPALAKAINNVAGWHHRHRRYEEAAQRYAEALIMKERFPNAEGVDRAKTMANLANIRMTLGRYEGVEELHLEALGLRRQASEPDYSDIARSLRGLGTYYHARGQLARAESHLREALQAYQQHDGHLATSNAASSINGLGRVLHDQGRLPEAMELYNQAFATRLEVFGEDHAHVVSSRLDLARGYLDAGQAAEASTELDKAEAWLASKSSTANLELRSRAEEIRGSLLLAEGRLAEAEAKLESALRRQEGSRDELGPQGQRVQRLLEEVRSRRQ